MSWREGRARAAGLELALCEWGSGDGLPTWILHGWLDQAAAWDGVAQRLPGRVFAPDHRGHGRSDWAPAYPFSDYLADLDCLIREPVHLVGHSMGGTMATLFASTRPERVRSLVLVEGLGPVSVSDQDAAEQLVAHLDQRRIPKQNPVFDSVESAAERLRRLSPSLDPTLALDLARRTVQPAPGGLTWTWDPNHRSRAAVAFDLERHLVHLARLQCPVTLVFGDQSWYLGMDRLAEREAAIATVRRRVLLPGGHNLHHDAPEALAALIRASLT